MNNADVEAQVGAAARECQARAEPAYRAQQLQAPPRLVGEDLADYRRRLLGPLAKYSATWQKVAVDALPEAALAIAEKQIYCDSITDAHRTSGPLREIVEVDRSGRQISRFFGDPEHCWGQFKQQARLVTAWNVKG